MQGKSLALSVAACLVAAWPAPPDAPPPAAPATLLEAVPGHAAPAPAAPCAAVAIAVRGQASAPPLQVDTERSVLVAKLKKAGLLRFLGHEHGVVPGAWSADVRFDPQDLEGSSIVVEIDASQLVIDTEEARRLAGVDPEGPSGEDLEEIRAKMVSEEQLDAEAHPTIRFESSTLRLPSDDELLIEGTLTIHGVSRPLEIDAELEPDGDGWVVRGDFEVEHTAFDIEPVSIGGVVKVADEIEIQFEVFAAPAPSVAGDTEG